MSKCISREGEYSEHRTENFSCTRCFVFDEDAALAYIVSLENQREAVLALHVTAGYWTGDPDAMTDENGEETEPEGRVCLHCSVEGVEFDLENWTFDADDEGVALWPCPTARALGVDS